LALALSVTIGSSAQIAVTTFTLTFYSMQSSLDVLHRTQIYYMAFGLIVLTGLLAGYLSARFYKLFNGTSWVRCAVATALFVPTVFAAYFISIDLIDWWERTLTTPFTLMSLILVLWVVLNCLTIFLGAWLGFLKPKMSVPAKPSRIKRQKSSVARKAPFYTSWLVTLPLGSFLCAACIETEVFYLVTSVWRQSYYMMFLYLLMALVLMSIVAI
jgi:transmembrane 9 superfamily member 2/4